MIQVVEFTAETSQAINQEPGKTPATRLLDLTAGWSAFVQGEEGAFPDPSVTVDDLTTLYQEAGELAFAAADTSREEEARRVRVFVAEQIIPLLLKTP